MLNWHKDSAKEASDAGASGSPVSEGSSSAQSGGVTTASGVPSKSVSASVRNPRAALGAILVEENVLTQAQLDEALKVKQEKGGFLGKILVDLKFIDQNTLVSFLVKQCKIPHISLVDYEITGDLFRFISKETCLEYNLLPIDKLGKILTVAMVDPLDIEALEHIRAACPDLKIKPILCDWNHFDSVARRLLCTEEAGPEELTVDSFGFSGGIPTARAAQNEERNGRGDAETELPNVVEALEEDANSAETAKSALKPQSTTQEGGGQAISRGPSSVEPFPASKLKRDKGRAPKPEQDALEALEGAGLRTRSDDRVRALLETEVPLEHYDFESFLVGPENTFTFSLAKAVADTPGKDYNPFYLCSGAGLGKTHLMNAIGNEVRVQHPNLRVGYVSATRFSQQVAEAAASARVGDFRDRYCRYDILLVDDLHFLEGRRQAQEELLHIFDAFCYEGRQLVIAGDRPPDDVPDLERALASRFAVGIVAALRPPEWETRMRILQYLARTAAVQIPEDILETIASRARDDVRKLSGALRKVIAFARLVGQDITKDLVNEILSHLGVEEAA